MYFSIKHVKFLTLSGWKGQINVTFPRLRKYTRHMKFLMHKGNVKQISHALELGNA